MKKSLPPPPKHLSDEAAGWWKRFVEGWEMDEGGLLLLESALESFDRMREAQAKLRKEGCVIKDRFGQPKMHPAAQVERDAKQLLIRHLKALNIDLEPLYSGTGRPPGGGK